MLNEWDAGSAMLKVLIGIIFMTFFLGWLLPRTWSKTTNQASNGVVWTHCRVHMFKPQNQRGRVIKNYPKGGPFAWTQQRPAKIHVLKAFQSRRSSNTSNIKIALCVMDNWNSKKDLKYTDCELSVLPCNCWALLCVYMGVSKNSDTPKSWILIGFSMINHPFCGTPLFGNTHTYIYIWSYILRPQVDHTGCIALNHLDIQPTSQYINNRWAAYRYVNWIKTWPLISTIWVGFPKQSNFSPILEIPSVNFEGVYKSSPPILAPSPNRTDLQILTPKTSPKTLPNSGSQQLISTARVASSTTLRGIIVTTTAAQQYTWNRSLKFLTSIVLALNATEIFPHLTDSRTPRLFLNSLLLRMVLEVLKKIHRICCNSLHS